MKTELKAVEILRMLAKDLSVTKECNPHKKVQTVEIHFTDDGKSIQEALAELAELTQEKSCEGCVEEYRKKSGLENYKNFGLEKSILVFPCNVCQRMATDHYTPEDKK